MPLPKPYKSESQEDFIARFMADKIMQQEYEAKPGKNQRYAIAISQFAKRNKKK